jgi:hypothetical protein
VVESELAHLALDTASINRDWPWTGVKGRDDVGERCLTELDPGELRHDRRLPCFVRQARPPTPGLARLGVELAMAPV